MSNKYKFFGIDTKTHEILKLEAVKRHITMKQLVHDAVIEYVERHKVFNSNLDPNTIEKIKTCVQQIYKPKNVKRFWINNLIDLVVKKTDIDKYLVEKGILKLIDSDILIKDYRDEVLYDSSLEERIKILNNMDGVMEKNSDEV